MNAFQLRTQSALTFSKFRCFDLQFCSTIDSKIMMNLTYRGAIALNNLGCSLLAKGCFRQARATLQDAVQLLKAVSAEVERKHCRSPDVQALIGQATQRLAFPYKDSKTATDFQIVSDEACHSSAFSGVSKGHTCFSQALLIYMEGSDDRDLELDSAIILHNYALTFLYHDSPNKDKSLRRLENANKILQLCQHILVRRHSGLQEADFALHHRVISVAYVTTYTHFQATCLGQTEGHTQAEKVYAKLLELHSTLQLLDGFDVQGTEAKSAAAA
jgi:hypothetical protein